MGHVLPTSLLRRIRPEDRKGMGKAGLLPEEIHEIQAAKSESKFQEQILSLLTRRGVNAAARARMDKRSTIPVGHPDIWFALNGRACAIEAKMPGKDAEPDQVEYIARMRKDGWLVAVVHTYAEALAAFEAFSNNKEP